MNFRLDNLNPINVALTCLHDESVEYIDERIVVLNNVNIADRGNYRIEIEHNQDNALLSINEIELINHNDDPKLKVDHNPNLKVNNRFTLSFFLAPSQVTMRIRVKFTIHKPLYGNNIEFRYKLVRDGDASNLPIGRISIVNVNSVYNRDNDRCRSCKKYYDALIDNIKSNEDGIQKTLECMDKYAEGLIFTNLVDFDMKWGHRRDAKSYGLGLEAFDAALPQIISAMNG